MRVTVVIALAAAVAVAAASGCDEHVGGLAPVGGDEPSEAEKERFARRLHLDLTGTAPTDAFLADAVARLSGDGGNTAAARAALADELIATAEFAALFTDELENEAFGGESADDRYQLYCGIVRNDVPACAACAPPSVPDACAECDCAMLADAFAERAALREAADDLAAGTTSSAIERRYAASTPFTYLSGPAGTATQLFEAFLGRPPEGEELTNATNIAAGTFVAGSPAGLLFHRHGADYYDLLDIVFESEIYREAMVARVFTRYLGRRATQRELTHFAADLDAADPDVRGVIRAVVSSGEYFEQ